MPPINPRVLVRLAHDVVTDTDDDSELAARLKDLASKHRIPYDGRAITKALDSARAQRQWSNRNVGNPHR